MTPGDRYLAELSAALAVPRRERRRIVAEVREHLHDAAAAAGEERAVARMGPAGPLAAQFVAQLATAGARRMALTVAVAVAVAVILVACGRLVLLLPPALTDSAHGALSRVAVQVATVAVAVTVVRSLRWRRSALIPLEQLRPMVAGGLVAIGGLLADAIAASALGLCVLLAAMLGLGGTSALRSLTRLARAQRVGGARGRG